MAKQGGAREAEYCSFQAPDIIIQGVRRFVYEHEIRGDCFAYFE
jgi:hypothetical protein